jgi:predicted amidohydrolase YtcJ
VAVASPAQRRTGTRPRQQLDNAGSVAVIQRRLRLRATPAGAGHGRGWTPVDFPEMRPPPLLDEVFPTPGLIRDRDGHHRWRIRALALAGARDTPDREDRTRSETASPRLLKEGASALVTRLLPALTADDTYALLVDEVAAAASFGLTSVQDATEGGLTENEHAAVVRAMAEGKLRVRYRAAIPFEKDATAEQLARFLYLIDSTRGGLFTYGFAKVSIFRGCEDRGDARAVRRRRHRASNVDAGGPESGGCVLRSRRDTGAAARHWRRGHPHGTRRLRACGERQPGA